MKKIITITTMYFFYMAQITPLFADDIELYQGGDAGIRPNVMFLLDTSGSMNNTVQLQGNTYDPTKTYPGPFRNDRLYFSELTDDGGDPDFLDNTIKDMLLDNTIHPDSFKCEAKKQELYTKGFAYSGYLQWDANQDYSVGYRFFSNWDEKENLQGVWRRLQTSDDPNAYVDCKLDTQDGNSHGLAANDGKPYMTHRANAQPYTHDSGIRIQNLANLGWYLITYLFSQIEPASAIVNRGYFCGIARNCVGSTETIWTGNRLNYKYATKNGVTSVPRLYLMGQIISDTVAQYPGLNVGLSRFDGRLIGDFTITIDGNPFTNPIKYDPPQGGMVAIEMVSSDSNALKFENTIKSWDPWGQTPLSESYYETALYMMGKPVDYGNRTKVFATRDSFLGIGGQYHDYFSIPESRIAGTPAIYKTPVESACQPNHIIVFSDGLPTEDTDANDEIQGLIKDLTLPDRSAVTCTPPFTNASGNFIGTGQACSDQLSKTCSGDGNCANELAYYLSSQDLFDDATSFAGTQSIKTHAISGFVNDATSEGKNTDFYLKSISETYGGGTFQEGDNEAEIRDALRSIFNNISTSTNSFTAPAVSVNAFNSLELGRELYYSVFEPSGDLSWKGNMKQYLMGEIGGEFAIVDADAELAIDKKTGFFADSARSIWTPADSEGNGDGNNVVAGGIANRLPSTRNAFTYPSTSNNGTPNALQPLSTATASLELLNIEGKDSNYHNELITWGIGQNRKTMEDPLHGEPAILTYSKSITKITNPDTGDVTEIKNLDRTLFLGTNSGFLHAFNINSVNPGEHFSFIPKELLKNLEAYKSGGGINAHKVYGIDGPITKWHKDLNGDGQVNGNDKAYIYITLRRGGQSFYALDVTNRSAPKLLWENHGTYPADFSNTPPSVSLGYENLGQTWGRLEPATINWQGTKRVVLFTPGGYDPIEDGSSANGTQNTGPVSRGAHSIGTTIYMIDALTGNVLWDAKKDYPSLAGQMTSSFPANVAPLDVTGDGLANMLYAMDVGGRIWRFDLNFEDKIDPASGVSGAIIADLTSGSGANNRQFYNEIDVIGDTGQESIFLSVGSGNRSHPKEKYDSNYHYVIKDKISRSSTQGIITQSDLAQWPTDSDYGWHIPLTYPGEKVLARSNTVADQILFTTFTPKDQVLGSCDVRPGTGRVYKIDLTKKTLQNKLLASGGIPPMPMLIPPKRNGNVTPPVCSTPGSCPPPTPEKGYSVLVGTEVVKFNDPIGSAYDNMRKDYWLETKQ